MDTIRLTGVQGMGTHGVLDYEHERAQPFIVDAVLYLDLSRAGSSDDLNDTVDYGRVAKRIVAVIEGEHVDLIERLAAIVIARRRDSRPSGRVPTHVTVHKPNAPITVPFDDVSVTVERCGETVDSQSRRAVKDHGQDASCHHRHGRQSGRCAATLRDAVRGYRWP